ncbi:MAG TPA: rubrerythrin [Deltaproteobacteria bacterium]|nr:rubrerythrin [Deltaproteobacteria bacterium]
MTNAIEIAIKMETDAIKFYKEAADKTKNSVGKKMFLTVREDEKRHLNMLTQIFKGLDVKAGNVSPMKNIKTVFELMKNEMIKKVEATQNELEAFKIASQMEKGGIEFYRKALSEAKTEKEKALFDKLIKEEEQHYSIFANSYSFLADTGNWFMWEEHSIVEG